MWYALSILGNIFMKCKCGGNEIRDVSIHEAQSEDTVLIKEIAILLNNFFIVFLSLFKNGDDENYYYTKFLVLNLFFVLEYV